MKPNDFRSVLVLPLLALLTLAQGCAPLPLRDLPPSVPLPPRVTPLPLQARQPPRPAICWPTCSDALKLELEDLRRKLTPLGSPAQPAR